jgi:hypothetical protein
VDSKVTLSHVGPCTEYHVLPYPGNNTDACTSIIKSYVLDASLVMGTTGQVAVFIYDIESLNT